MAQIGQFTRTETGFTGRLHTLILYREITLVPATPSDSENAPDYRVHHGDDDGPEIGAGWKRTGDRKVLEPLLQTLESLCQGGIYDHLAGGFARYTVDEAWLIPHFEKMLYDNAELVELMTLV